MIETVTDLLSWAAILAGSFFLMAGGIGVLRFSDFYSRVHAAGITDTGGAGSAPAAVGLGNSWQRGTDNPYDLMFWRIRARALANEGVPLIERLLEVQVHEIVNEILLLLFEARVVTHSLLQPLP